MTTDPLRCPRSSMPLNRLRIGGVDTDVCEDCGGLWLDRLELARFEQAGSLFGEALVAHLSQFAPTLVDHSLRLRCPRHPGVRRRCVASSPPQSRSKSTNVRECGGIWLDSGELAQVRR